MDCSYPRILVCLSFVLNVCVLIFSADNIIYWLYVFRSRNADKMQKTLVRMNLAQLIFLLSY